MFLAVIPKKDGTTTTNTDTATMKIPLISKLHRRRDGKVVMTVVEEPDAVLAVALCERELIPNSFERRGFEYTNEGGGNDVTYLAGFLQLLAPGVAHQIQRIALLVWETDGWSEDDIMGLFEPVDVMKMSDEGKKNTQMKIKMMMMMMMMKTKINKMKKATRSGRRMISQS